MGSGYPGKGGKGAYGLENDWSGGYSGYNFSYEDTALFALAQRAASTWQVPAPKKTSKPTLLSGYGSGGRECGIGCCNIVANGSFAELAGDHDHCDLDLPMMMYQEEGDVPSEQAPVEGVVPTSVPVSVPQSSTLEL